MKKLNYVMYAFCNDSELWSRFLARGRVLFMNYSEFNEHRVTI